MPGTVKSELFPGAVRKNTNVTGFEDTGKARFPEFILDNGHFITAVIWDIYSKSRQNYKRGK